MRKSWIYMGTTALVLGFTLVVVWLLAFVAIPVLLVGGLGAIILGAVLPNNKGFYFMYDSSKRKLVKKRV